MALVNVSKGSKVLGGHSAFLLPTAGQCQLLPLFPISKCYSYLHKEPRRQQMEIIGMERKGGLGCFLLGSLVGTSFASCTVL